ncbi:MAG TPA: hypothetical protein VGI39_41750 [Polyangiaceae bacterium]|jgi:hypothetical protein
MQRRLPFLALTALALTAAACNAPPAGSTGEANAENTASESADLRAAHLTFGATKAEALAGRTTSFALESTPDLVLHGQLTTAKYEGQTLLVRGTAPNGEVFWSYPHVAKGTAFDAVLPVFGSGAARKHLTGTYNFQVLAPDQTALASGKATFTSNRTAGHRAALAVDHEGAR